MMGWLRIEAMDFQGARQICRDALDPEVEDNPVNFFLGRNLIAKASLGLSDLATSRAQFQAIEHRIEVAGIPMDCIFYPLFYHTRCENFLALGDLGRAREEARLCYEAARLPPERTYFALAPRLLAKIAMAAGDLAEARRFLSEAVEAVDQGGLPLAARRIYATAAELYASLGEAEESAAFWRRSESCRRLLAQAFDQEIPLRALRGAAPASGALTGTRH